MPNEQEVERMKSLSKQNENLVEEEESSDKIEAGVEHEWQRSESSMNSPEPGDYWNDPLSSTIVRETTQRQLVDYRKYNPFRSPVSDDVDITHVEKTQRQREQEIISNQSYDQKDELVDVAMYEEPALYLEAEMYKEAALYLAATDGDLAHFESTLNQRSSTDPEGDILSRLSPTQNTFLHVAAKHGNLDIVKFIANKKPSLVLAKNFNGETALHLAAKSGDEAMVRALVEDLSLDETQKRNLLIAENEMGNTALHQALLSHWEPIASFLINQDSEQLYCLNKDGESAIYLAAKAGFVECVSSILERCTDESRLELLFENKSPIQAAMERKEIVVLKAITAKPKFKMIDSEGRNPLHFAASVGHLEATRYLQDRFRSNATRGDKRGELPIHVAALEGHVDVIRALLCCPFPVEELVDMSGCNILHFAAWNGRYNVFHFVLKNPKFDCLINMKNIYGDTPLHIATRNDHPKIVSMLTWDQRVDITAVNNDGMTALDVAYVSIQNPSFTKRLTWAALKSASVPQNMELGRIVNVNLDVCKERVNTLQLVATLVATVTFAAGFTMPGGYISSETGTDLGMATMWRHTVFHVFVLCDTIAMYTSILAVTALIWAQLGDTTFVIYALELAAPLLGVALFMMSMAFTAGVTIVVSKLRWLQITLLAMSTSFIALLLLLLLLLCVPLSSRSRILRYLSYYPFCLLILISSTERERSDY